MKRMAVPEEGPPHSKYKELQRLTVTNNAKPGKGFVGEVSNIADPADRDRKREVGAMRRRVKASHAARDAERLADKPSTALAEPVEVRALGRALDRPEWIERVKVAWRKGIEGIVETGQLLLFGHNAMPPDEFGALITREFGFSGSMARKLMCIGKDERITNCAIWHKLPRTWTTVYEISKLPDETFNAMLAEGSINPNMTKLVADNAVWVEKCRKFARIKNLPKKITKKAPTKPAQPAKPAALSRPQPLGAETAQDLLRYDRLVERLRSMPSNIAVATRFALPEDRRKMAELATEAINLLSHIYDGASPSASDER